MSIRLDDVITASPSAFSTEVDSELVLFDPERGEYFGSGPVGNRIWSMIDGKTHVVAIRDALLEEFEVEAAVCEAELLKFLNDLEDVGLVARAS